MSEGPFVYVAEVGIYSDRYIGGVFASPEAAMAAHAGTFVRDAGDHDGEEYEIWRNDLDWDRYVQITREWVQP